MTFWREFIGLLCVFSFAYLVAAATVVWRLSRSRERTEAERRRALKEQPYYRRTL